MTKNEVQLRSILDGIKSSFVEGIKTKNGRMGWREDIAAMRGTHPSMEKIGGFEDEEYISTESLFLRELAMREFNL